MYTHTIVKPDLTLSEYRQFHRPRLPLAAVQPSISWRFQTRVVSAAPGTKRRPGHPDGATAHGGRGGDASRHLLRAHLVVLVEEDLSRPGPPQL